MKRVLGGLICLLVVASLALADDQRRGMGGATSSTNGTSVVPNSAPNADYTFTPGTPHGDQIVTFSASGSEDPDGTVDSYEWDCNNDGLTDAIGSTVTHAFYVVGARPVTLVVTDNEGASSFIARVVPVQATPPVACYAFAPQQPIARQTISFDSSCSTDSDGTIILYEWNFGDGSPTATGLAVTHAYAAPGVYPVSLKVTDNDMEFDVTTQGVPVEMGGTGGVNQPPVADFSFAPAKGPDVNLNEVVTFKADGCSDKDGSIASYEWDFNNDGVYDATGKTVTHIFHRGGGQIVTLRVLDNEGAPGFKTEVVPVAFVRPTASFSFSPAKPRAGDVVTFDASSSSDVDGRVDFYEWDFDNDGKIDATGMTVTHAFETGGTRTVTLIVTDNDGVIDSIARSITLSGNLLEADIPVELFNQDFDNGDCKCNFDGVDNARSWLVEGVPLSVAPINGTNQWHLTNVVPRALQDLDASEHGFTAYFGRDDESHNPDFGSDCLKGNLYSPTVSVPKLLEGYELIVSFMSWRNVESYMDAPYDRTWIQVRLGTGAWQTIWSRSSIDPSQATWEWHEIRTGIPLASGNVVQLRFGFDSIDAYNNQADPETRGWLIDNVQVVAGIVEP